MFTAETVIGALGNPTRRAIVEMLSKQPLAVGEIAAGLPVSRPAVSQHLRLLQDVALVSCRSYGRRHVFHLNHRGFAAARGWLEKFWTLALEDFKAVAEESWEQGND